MIASERHGAGRFWKRRALLRITVLIEALIVAVLASAAIIVHEHAAGTPADTLLPDSAIIATQEAAWSGSTTAALHAIQADLPYLTTILGNGADDAHLSASADLAHGQVQITEYIESTQTDPFALALRAEADFLALNTAVWTGSDALHPPNDLKITIYYAPTTRPSCCIWPEMVAWVTMSTIWGERTSWASVPDGATAWWDYSTTWGASDLGPWGAHPHPLLP